MNFEFQSMCLGRMIVVSNDINGENSALSAVTLAGLIIEMDLGVHEYEVMLKVKLFCGYWQVKMKT